MTEELVPLVNIQDYAVRNTSAKMPIERKYVIAFLSSLFNSTGVKSVYEFLRQNMWNEDTPLIFLSYWPSIGELNEEPYRSIIAYAMLKKDDKLFEIISAAFFTGRFGIVYDQDFSGELLEYTDQNDPDAYYDPDNVSLMHYTDTDGHTDMVGGIPYLVFYDIYCDDIIEDDPALSSRYQTLRELKLSEEKFQLMMTICKPARAEVLMVYEPWCYITGDATTITTAGIAPNSPETPFSSPFGNSTYYNNIMNMSDEELKTYYKTFTLIDMSSGMQKASDEVAIVNQEGNLSERGDGYLLISFELMTKQTEFIWGNIIIRSRDTTVLPDIRFTPNNIVPQATTNHYFIKIQIKFPRPN